MLARSACPHLGGVNNALAQMATNDLAVRFPALSAAPGPSSNKLLTSLARYLARLSAPALLFTLMLPAVIEIGGLILTVWFLLFTSLRLAGCRAFAWLVRATNVCGGDEWFVAERLR